MMIVNAINRILDLANDKPIEVEGRNYWEKSGSGIRPPTVSPVAEVKSLDALLSALDAPELKALSEDLLRSLQLVVAGPREVSVVTAPESTWKQRHRYIDAICKTDRFPFDRFMEIEEFIIRAQCLFVDTDVKQSVIAHVSSIRGEEVISNLDDGISQTVVVEDKLTNRKNRSEFTPILELQPYRTFPEVDQPVSRFLLRMKKNGDKTPLVALFEADGGLWVSKACANVAAYLRNDERVKKLGIAVIG